MRTGLTWTVFISLVMYFAGCAEGDSTSSEGATGAGDTTQLTDVQLDSLEQDTELTTDTSDSTAAQLDSMESEDVLATGDVGGQSDVVEPQEDVSGVTEDTSPEPEDTSPEPEDTSPEPEDTTPEPEDTTPEPEDTTPEPEDTTPEPEDTTPEPEDTTPEPEDVSLPDTAPPVPPCNAVATITEPTMANDFFVVGDSIAVAATVSDPMGNLLSSYQVEWSDDGGNVLGTSSVDPSGLTNAVLTGVPKGKQELHARVTNANGPCLPDATHPILVCSADVEEDFNANLTNPWVIFGDATWSSSGYIDMTGIAQGKKGAVYNDAEYVFPGSVSIRFEVQTGGGSGSGADGFAMTIVETDDTNDLPVILSNAKSGGGLAYASQGGYGAPVVFKAFTVEIDTWHNVYNGNNEFHSDPTTDDHVELTLDLDAGQTIAWTSAGEIEDLAWHTIRVDVVGTFVKVWLDGVLEVSQDVPELDFRGGYIFFSGSTGYYTNYHRFDNLKIIHNCKSTPSSGS